MAIKEINSEISLNEENLKEERFIGPNGGSLNWVQEEINKLYKVHKDLNKLFVLEIDNLKQEINKLKETKILEK